MKTKKIISDKTSYGGMYVDKYFLHFEDGTDEQVNYGVWDQLEVGDEYIVADVPDSFVEAMKDIAEGITVTLDKALNEKPPINWKDAHDMQQKLVISYVLENEKLKDEIKLLNNSVKSVKNSFEYFQDRFYKQRDLTEKYKKRAIEAEEKLKPSKKTEEICKQIEEIYKERDYYKMHSHILETANDELDRANKTMKETLINIWECFEARSEIYHTDWHGFQALGNKARICLENIGYEWRNGKKDNKS
jgi:hypothetical protein